MEMVLACEHVWLACVCVRACTQVKQQQQKAPSPSCHDNPDLSSCSPVPIKTLRPSIISVAREQRECERERGRRRGGREGRRECEAEEDERKRRTGKWRAERRGGRRGETEMESEAACGFR